MCAGSASGGRAEKKPMRPHGASVAHRAAASVEIKFDDDYK